MKIAENLEIVDLALKYKDNLIIGDLHLGFEESLRGSGFLIPYSQLKKIIERLDKIVKKTKPKRIILNGDIKDEFGRVSNQEWNDILDFIDHFKKKAELIFIKGNHDAILDAIAKKRGIVLKEKLDIDDITILHGDKLVTNLKKTIIIGHEHPAISFQERPGEKFKCFITGKYKRHNLIVMPSFNTLLDGSDITNREFLSPYLKNIDNFKVYIVQDKVYDFGKVKDLPSIQ